MTSVKIKLLACTAAMVAASLSACHDDNNSASAPAPATNTPENFSTFAARTFQQPANSTPVNFDKITLLYDVNTDPNAFNALLM